MVSSQSIVINDYLSVNSKLKKSGSGKGRNSIAIKAQPLVHHFDDSAVGAGVAEAIRDELTKAIRAIREQASSATIRRRKGRSLPSNSTALFNDSGRLANGLGVRKDRATESFATTVPADRLTGETSDLLPRLVELVPMLRSPSAILANRAVAAEIEKSLELIMAKARDLNDVKRAQLKQARLNAAKAALSFARGLVG